MRIYALDSFPGVWDRFVASAVLVGLATLAVVLRLWARHVRKVALWIDDYAVIGSLFLLYILFAVEIADAKYGMRSHITKIPMDNLEVILQMLVAYQLIYGTTLLLGKSSYLFFYRRIFVSESFITATWALLGIVVAWYTANVLQVFLICRPFGFNWDLAVRGVCGNRPAAYATIGAINMATDFVIMVLPIHFIRQLQMPTATKIGVSLIFLIGLLICAISVVRMVVLARLDFGDISYDMLDSVFWTVVEPSLVITNACIPTMRPVVQAAVATFWSHLASEASKRRQVDEYPLTDHRDVQYTAKITGNGERARGDEEAGGEDMARSWSGEDHHTAQQDQDGLRTGSGVVHVSREWSVSR